MIFLYVDYPLAVAIELCVENYMLPIIFQQIADLKNLFIKLIQMQRFSSG